MNVVTPTRSNSPAFGMALKQKDVINKLKGFSKEELKEYLDSSKKIHSISKKTGFDIKLNKSIDHTKPDTFMLSIESKVHPDFRYKKDELTIKELQTQSKQLANEIVEFLKNEQKRIKNLDEITKKFS